MTQDELRKEYENQSKKNGFLTGLVIIILFGGFTLIMTEHYFFFLLTLLLAGTVYSFATKYSQNSTDLLHSLKISILNPLLKEKFDNVKYDPKQGFDLYFLKRYVKYVQGGTYSSKDYLEATYKDINFKYSHVYIYETVEDGKTTRFLGKVYEFIFPKTIKGFVSVAQPKMLDRFDGNDEIKVENIEFDEAFTVYSDNPQGVFYILTPHYMEKLISLNNKHNRDIEFFFEENKLIVTINDNDNLLDFSTFESEYQDDSIRKDLDKIINLINELDLHKKIK